MAYFTFKKTRVLEVARSREAGSVLYWNTETTSGTSVFEVNKTRGKYNDRNNSDPR
jgi:hypothetical protein